MLRFYFCETAACNFVDFCVFEGGDVVCASCGDYALVALEESAELFTPGGVELGEDVVQEEKGAGFGLFFYVVDFGEFE